jgi:hypothetical protein
VLECESSLTRRLCRNAEEAKTAKTTEFDRTL